MATNLFTAAPHTSPLTRAARVACLRLIRSEGVGPATFHDLIAHTGSPEAALAALPELARRGGRARAIRICTAAQAEAELEAAERIGASLLFSLEPAYPVALAAVDAPPPLIYVKGDAALLARAAVAIVGSRQCSAAGHKLAGRFARALGEAGLVIASGLARGIDAAAHEAALATGTIAVVAGGIDNIYPPEHADLHRRIAGSGCIVSEMPPGFTPRAQDFPRRNRIISGLSRGVLVIEAARRSGTLVTARLAGEQGREVFAVPGNPLDPRAEGTNRLLKSGATLVTEADDIIEALRPSLGQGDTRYGISDGAGGAWPGDGTEPETGSRSADRAPFADGSPCAGRALDTDFLSTDADSLDCTDRPSPTDSTPLAIDPARADGVRHTEHASLARSRSPTQDYAEGAHGAPTADAGAPETTQAHDSVRGAPDGASATSAAPHGASTNAPSNTALPASVTDAERARVLDALGPAPADVDSVARATGLAIQSVHVALLELNLGGHILRYPGGLVARVPEAEGLQA